MTVNRSQLIERVRTTLAENRKAPYAGGDFFPGRSGRGAIFQHPGTVGSERRNRSDCWRARAVEARTSYDSSWRIAWLSDRQPKPRPAPDAHFRQTTFLSL